MTELLSIKLTEYALLTLRAKARDDTFAAQIKNYLSHTNSNTTVENSNSSFTSSSNSATLSLSADIANPARDPLTRNSAVVRKRVYDKYALECKQSAHKHAFDQELNRRRMALFLYLIRSPVFDRYIMSKVYYCNIGSIMRWHPYFGQLCLFILRSFLHTTERPTRFCKLWLPV